IYEIKTYSLPPKADSTKKVITTMTSAVSCCSWVNNRYLSTRVSAPIIKKHFRRNVTISGRCRAITTIFLELMDINNALAHSINHKTTGLTPKSGNLSLTLLEPIQKKLRLTLGYAHIESRIKACSLPISLILKVHKRSMLLIFCWQKSQG